jgi:hypothetical protein
MLFDLSMNVIHNYLEWNSAYSQGVRQVLQLLQYIDDCRPRMLATDSVPRLHT